MWGQASEMCHTENQSQVISLFLFPLGGSIKEVGLALPELWHMTERKIIFLLHYLVQFCLGEDHFTSSQIPSNFSGPEAAYTDPALLYSSSHLQEKPWKKKKKPLDLEARD